MKFLFDFVPIILFFIAYKLGGIYVATIIAIVTSILQVAWSRYSTGKFEKLPLVTLATLVVFGGATLLLRNELFIKWKPTILYWVLAIIFFASQFIGNKPLFQKVMEKNIQLHDKIWLQLNFSWVVFFLFMGSANLYMLYSFDTNTWVNFKLFGALGLTLLFIILQGLYMARHQKMSGQTFSTHQGCTRRGESEMARVIDGANQQSSEKEQK
jgi:intracellular septation protein